VPIDTVRERYGIKDTPHWSFAKARKLIDRSNIGSLIHPITYRPFDRRWIYYNPQIIEKGDSKYPTLRHMMSPNIALLTSRIQAAETFNAVFVSDVLVEMKTAESTRSSTVFPLYSYYEDSGAQRSLDHETRHANLLPEFTKRLSQGLGLTYRENERGDPNQQFGAAEIFNYMYAVLYSSTYRERYSEFLRVDFPRIPLTSDAELFATLCSLGADLVALHLLEDDYEAASWNANSAVGRNPFAHLITSLKGRGDVEVAKGYPKYNDARVYINPSRYFEGIPEDVWNFQVGGYQVCEKWLKDRRGRTLADADIDHYQRIIVALNETLRLMAEIDRAIEDHGGWPLVGSQDPPKAEAANALPFG